MNFSVLPEGTRVKRGPTWEWGNQDESGVGVVILRLGLLYEGFTLRVRWPDGSTNGYRYTDIYKDVIPVEPKTFEDFL